MLYALPSVGSIVSLDCGYKTYRGLNFTYNFLLSFWFDYVFVDSLYLIAEFTSLPLNKARYVVLITWFWDISPSLISNDGEEELPSESPGEPLLG